MSCVAWAPQSLMHEPMRDLVRTRATADRAGHGPAAFARVSTTAERLSAREPGPGRLPIGMGMDMWPTFAQAE
jgi:hypothetical protein